MPQCSQGDKHRERKAVSSQDGVRLKKGLKRFLSREVSPGAGYSGDWGLGPPALEPKPYFLASVRQPGVPLRSDPGLDALCSGLCYAGQAGMLGAPQISKVSGL